MTVQYSSNVATATGSIGFMRLLFRWTGSIYKVVWMNLLLYMMLFFFLSYTYHYVLDRSQQQIFEKLCVFCRQYVSTIPLSFILGFYVDIVMERWWEQFTKIPWPDATGFAVITSVKGTSDKSRLIRRTIMRYVNLSFVMTMQLVSPPCKERFPTWDHMVDAGFLLDQEKEIIEHLSDQTDEPKYWLPLAWAANIAAKARKEDKIYDDVSFSYLVKEINAFRTRCQIILCYDWICIPIVYTQVVTIACYLYFTTSILARQFLESSEFVLDQEGGEDFNMIVPIFLFVEFFFYFGWLNVAETMVNPFGSDDDDFDVNYLIDRHLKVSYAMVDDITSLMPEMAQDVYWNEKGGVELPYAKDQMKLKNRTETFQGSAAGEVVRGREGSFLVDVAADQSSKNMIVGFGSKSYIPAVYTVSNLSNSRSSTIRQHSIAEPYVSPLTATFPRPKSADDVSPEHSPSESVSQETIRKVIHRGMVQPQIKKAFQATPTPETETSHHVVFIDRRDSTVHPDMHVPSVVPSKLFKEAQPEAPVSLPEHGAGVTALVPVPQRLSSETEVKLLIEKSRNALKNDEAEPVMHPAVTVDVEFTQPSTTLFLKTISSIFLKRPKSKK